MKINLVFQLIVSILLIVLIMLQSRDSGITSPFGATQTGFHTKTGPEKAIYVITIFLSVIFILLSLYNIANS